MKMAACKQIFGAVQQNLKDMSFNKSNDDTMEKTRNSYAFQVI